MNKLIPIQFRLNQKGGLTEIDIFNIINGPKSEVYIQKINFINTLSDDDQRKINYIKIVTEQINNDIGKSLFITFLDDIQIVSTEEICSNVSTKLPTNEKLYDVPVDGDCGFACILLKLIFDKSLNLHHFKSLSNKKLVAPHSTVLENNTIISFNNTASKYCYLSENTRCFPKILINSLRSILMASPEDNPNRGEYIDHNDIFKFMEYFNYNCEIYVYNKFQHNDSSYDFNMNKDDSFEQTCNLLNIKRDYQRTIKLLLIRNTEFGNSGSHYVLIDDKSHETIYNLVFPPLNREIICNQHLNGITFEDFCTKYGSVINLKHIIINCNR